MNRQRTHKSKNQNARHYVMGVLPTSERHRQQGGLRCGFVRAESPNALTPRYRARWASPLELYHDRQIIGHEEYLAGLQFGRAYHHTVSSIPACCERARLFGTPEEPPDLFDTPMMRALECVEQAYAALSADTMGVVIDVCAYARPAASPDALGKLRKGLGRLTLAWGMASTELCYRKSD